MRLSRGWRSSSLPFNLPHGDDEMGWESWLCWIGILTKRITIDAFRRTKSTSSLWLAVDGDIRYVRGGKFYDDTLLIIVDKKRGFEQVGGIW